ncbi:MAG: hypothetical protein ACJ75J_13445 [Cytophagaceae bacterium]
MKIESLRLSLLRRSKTVGGKDTQLLPLTRSFVPQDDKSKYCINKKKSSNQSSF